MSTKAKALLSESQNVENTIKMTLTSRKTDALEIAMKNYIEKAKSAKIIFKGPRRFPTKTLRITTRKSPCGEGTNTWDRFEMRIHKRVIEFYARPEWVSELVNAHSENDVKVELVFA